MAQSSGGTEDNQKSFGYWNMLPSFDPANDDIREFTQKARFLYGILPKKEKVHLAPKLAMQCKGTAWHQVRQLDPEKLVVQETGLDYLLESLSAWEETSELKTYELFEKAIYRVIQKADEAPHSFALRLHSAFDDIGSDVTLKEMHAFILLKQSSLNNEDKKKVLTMTNGSLEVREIEKAMRTLSTKVLMGSGEVKKKVYPTNYVEPEEPRKMRQLPTRLSLPTPKRKRCISRSSWITSRPWAMRTPCMFKALRAILRRCFRVCPICTPHLSPTRRQGRGSTTRREDEDFGHHVAKEKVDPLTEDPKASGREEEKEKMNS